ncbi:MAG: hypothetical protein JSU62_06700 [Gammaproteobacteria bacterium]|nr:MAG: hypothetical protein JSU62_06700 [Gammaproteobacteria bacterium]
MNKPISTIVLRVAAQLSLILFLGACSEKSSDTAAEAPATPPASSVVQTPTKGMYFKPDLSGFGLHNEYDDDGDGDGIKETHVRRYINGAGDTAFSMTTHGTLWAWSLDTKGDDDSDIHKNFVIRDSNCDKVFDERYSLDAQFHVPGCTAQGDTAEKPGGI